MHTLAEVSAKAEFRNMYLHVKLFITIKITRNLRVSED